MVSKRRKEITPLIKRGGNGYNQLVELSLI